MVKYENVCNRKCFKSNFMIILYVFDDKFDLQGIFIYKTALKRNCIYTLYILYTSINVIPNMFCTICCKLCLYLTFRPNCTFEFIELLRKPLRSLSLLWKILKLLIKTWQVYEKTTLEYSEPTRYLSVDFRLALLPALGRPKLLLLLL